MSCAAQLINLKITVPRALIPVTSYHVIMMMKKIKVEWKDKKHLTTAFYCSFLDNTGDNFRFGLPDCEWWLENKKNK
jgi:hypothetical protein